MIITCVQTLTVSCSSSLGSAPPIICDHGLSRVMAAYMLNLNMESGANIKLTVISLVCVCVCVCGLEMQEGSGEGNSDYCV